MALAVDNNVAPTSFVCHGRDFRDVCRSFAFSWEAFEEKGTLECLLRVYGDFARIQLLMSSMDFNRYAQGFDLMPSAIEDDNVHPSIKDKDNLRRITIPEVVN